MSARTVIKAIKKHSKFLITSHIDIEGDALGSELALASLLRKSGKQAYIVNSDKTPTNYSFLPGVKRIYRGLDNRVFEAALVIDCPNKQRTGRVASLIDNEKPIINIDHHISNRNFGKINWVDSCASSAGEMIYHLFELMRVNLDRKDALNIYTAILTDTGSFRHSNTTSRVFRIASDLLKFGIDPAKIYAKIYESNSAQDAALMAKAVSRISFAANNRIAWVKIGALEFKKMHRRPEVLDKILDFAKSINTVKVVITFCQIGSRLIKLSLRSKSPINVQKIASRLGGGGHKYASGCTIKGSLNEAERKVLKQVKRTLV